MHELSLVLAVVDIAAAELAKAQAEEVVEIVLDIGVQSTVEMASFDFAWGPAVKNTVLERARKTVHRVPGAELRVRSMIVH